MSDRMKLEQMCRESFKKLLRAEIELGIDSPVADMFRSEWSAFDRAYCLVFRERIDYSTTMLNYMNRNSTYEP